MYKNFRLLVIVAFVVFGLSGVVVTLIENHILEVEKPMRSFLIRMHVSLSFLFAILFGMILEKHILKVWKNRDFGKGKRYFGFAIVGTFSVLVISSFVIRFFKEPSVQEPAILVHWLVGIVFVMCGFLHFVVKKKLDKIKIK